MPPIDTEATDTETTQDTAVSLRDTLSQVFDAHTEEPDVEQPEPVEQPAAEPLEGETQEQADARARDEAGRFTKQSKKSAVKPGPKVELKPSVKPTVQPAQTKSPVPTSAQPAVPEMKAPQAWREPTKKLWSQLPEPVRVEVLRREKEIATQLTTFGEERKYAQTMRQAFAPFEAHIAAEGSHPAQTIRNLMQTALALRTAPPAHKAALVADMINQFGVPLDHLVAALEGKQPAPGQHQAPQQVDPAAIAKQVEERLLQQLGSKREEALAAKVQGELDAFLQDKPMHGLDGSDYGEEIRETMADLIDAAVKRKSTITLDKAYSMAARMHPEVSKVLERTEQAAKAAKANASTQRARAASSSVRNSPTTQPVKQSGGNSLRDRLSEAWEQHEG